MIGGHGHVTPRPDGAKARCGGPAICGECARELGALPGRASPEPEHVPRRGDDVEQWLKRWRDRERWPPMTWHMLNSLLDDYRLHADTGTPLHVEVEER